MNKEWDFDALQEINIFDFQENLASNKNQTWYESKSRDFPTQGWENISANIETRNVSSK